MKAGFTGEEMPQLVFPSYVGKAKYEYVIPSNQNTQHHVGNLRDEQRGLLKLNYPVEHGIVKDWKSLDLLYSHIFQELKINLKETPIFLTEPPLNPIDQKIKHAELFFETYGVPALFLGV